MMSGWRSDTAAAAGRDDAVASDAAVGDRSVIESTVVTDAAATVFDSPIKDGMDRADDKPSHNIHAAGEITELVISQLH